MKYIELNNLCKKCKYNKDCWFLDNDERCDDYENILEDLINVYFFKNDFKFDKLFIDRKSKFSYVTYALDDIIISYKTHYTDIYNIIIELHLKIFHIKNKRKEFDK